MTWKQLAEKAAEAAVQTPDEPVKGTFGDSEMPGDNAPCRLVQVTFDDRGYRLVLWPMGA